MFKNLYRKIYLPLFLLALTLIVLTDAFAAVAQLDALNDTYFAMGEQRLTRIMNSCKLYLSSADATAYDLSVDETLVNELHEPTGTSLVQKLNDTCNFTRKISAITVYNAQPSGGNLISYSANIGNAPLTLKELEADAGIAEFLKSDKENYISVRTHAMADIYGSTKYDKNMGIITCCRKVYYDGGVVGVIFADILPANLYAYVSGEGQFENAISFMSFDGGYFSYGENTEHEKLLSSSNPRGYFKHSSKSDDNLYTLTVFDSKAEYYSKVTVLISVMVVASALLIVAVHFGARAIAGSVTSRLDKFLDKMNAQQLP